VREDVEDFRIVGEVGEMGVAGSESSLSVLKLSVECAFANTVAVLVSDALSGLWTVVSAATVSMFETPGNMPRSAKGLASDSLDTEVGIPVASVASGSSSGGGFTLFLYNSL
jgi:hypothetical protein